MNKAARISEQKKLDKIAQQYTAQLGFEKVLTEYKAKEITSFSKGKRVLDIGCGEGRITKEIAKKHREVVAIDGSESKIKMAKRLSQATTIKYQVTMFESYFPSKKFDCVVASNILEHVKNPQKFLEKTYKLLKKNGRLIITVPNAVGLHKRIGKQMGLINNFYKLTEDDLKKGHRRIYDKKKLEKEITNAGFKIKHSGGILLKPLSHKQMETWDRNICDALYEIGKQLPEYCSSLIVVADK